MCHLALGQGWGTLPVSPCPGHLRSSLWWQQQNGMFLHLGSAAQPDAAMGCLVAVIPHEKVGRNKEHGSISLMLKQARRCSDHDAPRSTGAGMWGQSPVASLGVAGRRGEGEHKAE